jgi:hypothetical protein
LLLYAHRDEPPFRTHVVPVPAALATLTAHFPAELVYESELRSIRLRGAEGTAGRNREFSVSTSASIFKRSRTVVLNLVLRPRGAARGESQLNEYDLIKLIKLWEGGEGRSAQGWGREILFKKAGGESGTLDETARELFQDWLPRLEEEADRALQPAPPLSYRVGTIELQVPRTRWRDQLFRDIAQLKEGGEAPDKQRRRARWDRVVALGGVLQGLLDFQEINSDELVDVFAEVDIDPEDRSLVGYHKGTLLSLSEPDDEQRPSPIEVDPYLALPNVVLLHNEQQLKAARQLELRLSYGQPGRSASRGERVDIDQTANGLDVITGLLAQNLPNIFHYPAERRLYETGGHSRGFDDLETLIRRRREELASTLQRRERRRDTWTAVLAIISAVFIGVVAAVQNLLVKEAIETLDWWLLLIFAGFLYLAFFRLRRRFF